jgi:hypothetical protein
LGPGDGSNHWDQQYNIKPTSLSQLGLEGHWLLDGIDRAGYEVVVHEVPPIPRFILLKGFAARYRRRAAACWSPGPAKAGGIKRSGQVEVVVHAPVEAVWEVLSDVTRVGEWSHECRSAEWLGGARAAAPGVRFRGRNKTGRVRWSRVNEVVRVEGLREIAWRTQPSPAVPGQHRVALRAGARRQRHPYRPDLSGAPPARLLRLAVLADAPDPSQPDRCAHGRSAPSRRSRRPGGRRRTGPAPGELMARTARAAPQHSAVSTQDSALSTSGRVLISCFPGYGHLHPLLPLATAYREAGCDVAVATAGELCQRAERYGFRPSLPAYPRRPRSGAIWIVIRAPTGCRPRSACWRSWPGCSWTLPLGSGFVIWRRWSSAGSPI